MRCLACFEQVDETQAIPLDSDLVCAIVAGTPEDGATVYSVRAHVRYVPGVLPARPDTSELHAGPVVCGPLEEERA